MKRNLLILTLLFFGILGKAENEKIELKGKLIAPDSKSISQDLEVVFQDNEVTIHFLECLGTLDVSVESSSGQTVYQRTINSCAENTILIDTNNWNAGWYKIIITDIYGGYLEGWFEI
ncbi:MAG: DUF3244 domain-containing protein [Marinilabiliaceae bacterium]|nr:DUF3244 domain-containing protein [Marinilabiliaceae bacterium]